MVDFYTTRHLRGFAIPDHFCYITCCVIFCINLASILCDFPLLHRYTKIWAPYFDLKQYNDCGVTETKVSQSCSASMSFLYPLKHHSLTHCRHFSTKLCIRATQRHFDPSIPQLMSFLRLPNSHTFCYKFMPSQEPL